MLFSILPCSSKAIFFLLKQITGSRWIKKDVCYSQRYSFYCTHLTDVSDGTGQGGKGSGRMKEIEIIPSVWPDLEESHS